MSTVLQLDAITITDRLRDISTAIGAGEIWHLLGANGSGKSSLLSAVAGILNTEGEIFWREQNIRDLSLPELSICRCLLPQQHHLHFEVSVKECFFMLHKVRKVPEQLVDTLVLSPLLDKSMYALSGGELQRVYIALHLTQVWPAIENGEALVLLDEPTQQLDPAFQSKALQLIASIADLGNVVIQSHHDVNQTLHYATHAMLIKNGEMLAQGNADEVINADTMARLYDQRFIEITADSSQKRYLLVKEPP